MKKVFIFSAVFFDAVFMLIVLFTFAVSAYDYFAGTNFEDSYPLFCEILYGDVLKYDVLLVFVFFVFAFVQAVIDDKRKGA